MIAPPRRPTSALGEVDRDSHQAVCLAGGREMEPPPRSDPTHFAVHQNPVFHVDGITLLARALDNALNEVPVVWMDRRLDAFGNREPRVPPLQNPPPGSHVPRHREARRTSRAVPAR